jgi:short-subunit dehydrogenase
MELKSKTVLITGASKGMGNSIAKKLAQEGANLILVARNEENLKDLVNNLSKGSHKYYVCDFEDFKQVENLIENISSDYQKVDVLINGAGIGIYKPIEEVTFDEWRKSFSIGLDAPYFLIQKLLPLLSKAEKTVVINIGSGMGVIPAPGRSVYCALKFALRGMTLSLAEEFKRTKIQFVLLTLGSVLTGFGPKTIEEKKNEGKAYLTPEWVAERVSEIIKEDGKIVEYTFYPSDYKEEWQQ